MKSFIQSILNQFDFFIHRKSLYDKSNDPIYILNVLFEKIELKTIIDGGASIGTLSQKFSSTFPGTQIHAFEPYQSHFDSLQLLATDNKCIIPVKKALSNFNGNRSFFLNHSSGTNSLLQSNQQGRVIYGDQLKEIGQIEVECISLDQYLKSNNIESVDIFKLDLQGGELDALDGSSKAIMDGKIKCILCEILFSKCYEKQPSAGKLLYKLISEFNFTLFNFYQSNYYKGKLIFCDAIFFHHSIIDEIEKNSSEVFHNYSDLLIS